MLRRTRDAQRCSSGQNQDGETLSSSLRFCLRCFSASTSFWRIRSSSSRLLFSSSADDPTTKFPREFALRLSSRNAYWIELAACENTVLALDPTNRIVPTSA